MDPLPIRQTTVWEGLERELPPGLKEVSAFLRAVPCDELIRKLEQERGKGRDDYPVRPMCRLILSKLYLRHGRFSDLLAEIRRNSDLARVLELQEILPNRFKTPPPSAVSRFYSKLKGTECLEELKRLFQRTVELLKAERPELGKRTALDASDIRTHGHAERKNQAGEKLRPSTDPEASWSVKTKRWEDAQGRKREETKSTFGYKGYFCVDVEVPAVLAVKTVTGKTNDQDMAMPVLDAAIENVGEDEIETCSMDKGFDSTENVQGAFQRHVAAIIPVRDVPENLEQMPKEDREVPLSTNSNIVRDRYSGEVACYAPSAAGQVIRREMIYGGFERERESHKFRCPLGSAASEACSAYRACCAGTSGKQGKQVRVSMETDIRRFAPVYPRTKRWQRLYNGRSAVERINSYLKEVLRLEDHCLRGKAAISLRVLLAAITLNVRTLLALQAAKEEKQTLPAG